MLFGELEVFFRFICFGKRWLAQCFEFCDLLGNRRVVSSYEESLLVEIERFEELTVFFELLRGEDAPIELLFISERKLKDGNASVR